MPTIYPTPGHPRVATVLRWLGSASSISLDVSGLPMERIDVIRTNVRRALKRGGRQFVGTTEIGAGGRFVLTLREVGHEDTRDPGRVA